MEIEITSLLEVDQFQLSHSRAEGGQDAGRNTWQAAKQAARETVLLDTEEKLDAMRDFAHSSGGWTREEIAAWSAEEINALFLQWVAGDCREAGADSLGEIDWQGYETDCEAGAASSRFYKTEDGRIYFSLSN